MKVKKLIALLEKADKNATVYLRNVDPDDLKEYVKVSEVVSFESHDVIRKIVIKGVLIDQW